MNKVHPITIVIIGLLVVSLLFNYLQSIDNGKLNYRIQKLESGPWKSLFEGKPVFPNEPEEKEHNIKPNTKTLVT